MDNKRVYILGAGSSMGHSEGIFPSITTFFSSARRFGFFSNQKFAELASYAKEVLGLDIKHKINIEDLFTHIEIELERTSSARLLEIRQKLFDLIQGVLTEAEKTITNKTGEYHKLNSKLKKKDTIITFNWDLLLDNILKRERILKDRYTHKEDKEARAGQYWQFIHHLSALGETTWEHVGVAEPYHDWNPESGFYLKAHGSIDWFYCLNQSCRAFRKVFPALDLAKGYYCSECNEPLEHLLIPPVLNKGYRHYPLIRRIWNMAAMELSAANELIIWGYSLPPTDFYSSWLLRQSRKASLNKIAIINPSVLRGKKRRKPDVSLSFVRRFYNIVRGEQRKEIIALYESFSDYCNGSNIFDKYNLGSSEDALKRL